MSTKHTDPEPLFTLRAQDKYAPVTVMYWAQEAASAGAPKEKVDEATAIATRMIEWQMKNGSKVPD